MHDTYILHRYYKCLKDDHVSRSRHSCTKTQRKPTENSIVTSCEKSTWKARKFSFCACVICYKCQIETLFVCLARTRTLLSSILVFQHLIFGRFSLVGVETCLYDHTYDHSSVLTCGQCRRTRSFLALHHDFFGSIDRLVSPSESPDLFI